MSVFGFFVRHHDSVDPFHFSPNFQLSVVFFFFTFLPWTANSDSSHAGSFRWARPRFPIAAPTQKLDDVKKLSLFPSPASGLTLRVSPSRLLSGPGPMDGPYLFCLRTFLLLSTGYLPFDLSRLEVCRGDCLTWEVILPVSEWRFSFSFRLPGPRQERPGLFDAVTSCSFAEAVPSRG